MSATETRSKTLDMVYIAMFAVLMAICSWISIPSTVPFTLQTFGVFLAVGVLGGKRGSLSVLIYILLGCVGVPVYATMNAGVSVLFGKTGGCRFPRWYWDYFRQYGRLHHRLPLFCTFYVGNGEGFG